jgi:acyl-CoA thioesterase
VGADGQLAEATRVEPVDGDTYRGAIAPGWDIAGNANGGYLLALATRAVLERSGRPDPVTVTGHYLAPGRPGPVEVHTEEVRTGRRFTTATAALRDADRELLRVLATVGDLAAPGDGPERVESGPPALPDPDDCPAMEPTDGFPPPLMGRIELRLHPDDAGFAVGAPTGDPLMRGWFRLRDGEPTTSLALLVAADAFPPTAFSAALPVAWTPTVELTVHVRGRPAPGWLACAFRTRFVTAGFLEEDGEVWDATGRLVAQSRQPALVPQA